MVRSKYTVIDTNIFESTEELPVDYLYVAVATGITLVASTAIALLLKKGRNSKPKQEV